MSPIAASTPSGGVQKPSANTPQAACAVRGSLALQRRHHHNHIFFRKACARCAVANIAYNSAAHPRVCAVILCSGVARQAVVIFAFLFSFGCRLQCELPAKAYAVRMSQLHGSRYMRAAAARGAARAVGAAATVTVAACAASTESPS